MTVLTTPTWGPWGTDLHDIGRVIEAERGAWWEVVPIVGRMRGKVIVPDVATESGVHLQAATPDLSAWRLRSQLQWRDIETVDTTVAAVDGEDARVVRLTFTNHDRVDHRYVASLMARVHGHHQTLADRPTCGWQARVVLSGAHLPTGKDGFPAGVCVHPDLLDGEGLGFWGGTPVAPFKGAHAQRSHCLVPGVRSSLVIPEPARVLWLRAGYDAIDGFALTINGHAVTMPAAGELGWCRVQLANPTREVEVVITGGEPGVRPRAVLDALAWGEAGPPLMERRPAPGVSEACLQGADGMYLVDSALPDWHAAIVTDGRRPLPPEPYGDGALIRVEHNELAGWGVRRKLGNDSLLPWGSHNANLGGNGQGVYHGLAIGPISVPAGAQREVTAAVACGPQSTDVTARARCVVADAAGYLAAADERLRQWAQRPAMTTGHRLLVAHTNANVSWPVRRGSQVIACDTPGKRWGGLFTWDSAMHGFGHLADDPARARTIVETYCSHDDYPDAPELVLHGSPLPLHVHLTWGWFQRTGDRDGLTALVPKLAHLLDWFLARTGSGGPTGLLTTYDQFYNGFGIDDDPLQHRVERAHLAGAVAPVATSAHVARACRTLAALASEVGDDAVAKRYAAAADDLLQALVQWSWNQQRGRFEWVHLSDGTWFSQHPEGAVNDGIDALAPLCAGLDDQRVADALEQALFDPDAYWTPAGATAQARNGASARPDGYWNGAVWIPHQFLLALGLLGQGRARSALRLAQHAIDLHHAAAATTDNSYELFDCDSRQGEGCHNFAGLSSPVAYLHDALTRPGAVTAGMDTIIDSVQLGEHDLRVTLRNPVRPGVTGLWLVPPKQANGRVLLDGEAVAAERVGDVLLVDVTLTSRSATLQVV